MLSASFMRVSRAFNSITALKPSFAAWLCFGAGLISALALQPVSIPFFFFLGFSAFYAALQGVQSLRSAFWRAWLFSLGFHLAGLYWISASLFIDIQKYFWVLPFSLLALPSYLALLFALGAMAVHKFKRHGLAYASLLAAALFATELARNWLLTGFPWNLFGYIWTNALPLLQSVSLFGIFGLTLLTLLLATVLAELLLRPSKNAWLALASLALVFSGLSLWGTVRLEEKTSFVPDVHLRIVQGAVQQSERRTHEQRVAAFSRYVSLSTEKATIKPTHLIWPETATPYFLNEDEVIRKALARIIPKNGGLITGAPNKYVEDKELKYFNSVNVLDDAGNIIGLYNKAQLVPFGEFIPLRNILKTVPVAADIIGARDFSFGPGPRSLRAPSLPAFSPLVCYEAIFTRRVIDEADRPNFLLQVTNDAWFGNTSGPYQHYAMARVRAIEEGLPLVRAANTGISAVVDGYGRIMNELGLGEMGVLDAALPEPIKTKTFYAHTGVCTALIAGLFLILFSLLIIFRNKKQAA